jgi:hypothetical protein
VWFSPKDAVLVGPFPLSKRVLSFVSWPTVQVGTGSKALTQIRAKFQVYYRIVPALAGGQQHRAEILVKFCGVATA